MRSGLSSVATLVAFSLAGVPAVAQVTVSPELAESALPDADFQDLIYVNERTPGADAAQGLQVPTGLQIGSGVRVAGITKVFSQGGLVNTSNPFDIAIEGQGFLQVLMPNGETRYTRDGAMRQNPQGNLVTTDGFLITPQVTIPQDAVNVAIGSDGTVNITNAQGQASVVGQLTLVRFPNPAGLSVHQLAQLARRDPTAADADRVVAAATGQRAASDGDITLTGGYDVSPAADTLRKAPAPVVPLDRNRDPGSILDLGKGK